MAILDGKFVWNYFTISYPINCDNSSHLYLGVLTFAKLKTLIANTISNIDEICYVKIQAGMFAKYKYAYKFFSQTHLKKKKLNSFDMYKVPLNYSFSDVWNIGWEHFVIDVLRLSYLPYGSYVQLQTSFYGKLNHVFL